MREIRIYMPEDLVARIDSRCKVLECNRSEYLRKLAYLDISIDYYQQLTKYVNRTSNAINSIHEELGVYVTPLQEIPELSIFSME